MGPSCSVVYKNKNKKMVENFIGMHQVTAPLEILTLLTPTGPATSNLPHLLFERLTPIHNKIWQPFLFTSSWLMFIWARVKQHVHSFLGGKGRPGANQHVHLYHVLSSMPPTRNECMGWFTQIVHMGPSSTKWWGNSPWMRGSSISLLAFS